MFKKKKTEDMVEQRFDAMMELIKDLHRAEFNRLKGAMDLGYSAYQKVRNVKTADEKEVEDILNAEKILGKEKDDN
jgi:nucleoid DNA-binding protein